MAIKLLVLGSVLSSLLILGLVIAAQTSGGPSTLCHVSDGKFTVCPDGEKEWSDITPTVFPDTGGIVYVDQADLVDNSSISTGQIVFTPDGKLDHLATSTAT